VRTNIDIDDRLMRRAMRRSGARTKKATVEAALRLLAETHEQGAIRKLRGRIRWEGDLEQSRLSRVVD
jgi:Arc/MetJ family transcription regulator